MKSSRFFIILILALNLSACEKIEHVKEFPKLKSDYEEAQKRIGDLEKRNAKLESRLKNQESEPNFLTQSKDNQQAKSLKMLLTSEK